MFSKTPPTKTLSFGVVPQLEDGLVAVTRAKLTERMRRQEWLSQDELARAGRFKFDVDRERWISARTLLRLVLSRSLDVEPGAIRFRYGPFGKPYLDPSAHTSAIHFNLTHTQDTASVAVTSIGDIGIDSELRRVSGEPNQLEPQLGAVGEAVFSPDELAYVQDAKTTAYYRFYRIWTLKEAWLKMIGTGLIDNIRDYSVLKLDALPSSFNPHEERVPITLCSVGGSGTCAIAVKGRVQRIAIGILRDAAT